jgi:hypothetical protein
MIDVTGTAADVSLAIAFDGFRLQEPSFSSVRGGTIEGAPIAPTNSVSHSVEDGSLKLELGYPAATMAEALSIPIRTSSQAGQLDLDEDVRVFARLAAIEERSTKIQMGRPPEQTVTAVFRDWIAARRAPAVWAGRIRGDFSKRVRGNLVLAETGSSGRFSSANVRLQGGYVWSVLAANGETAVVIDTANRDLDFRILVADFCALQFTFGRRVQIEWLAGLDETGSAVAWAGSSSLLIGGKPSEIGLAPVPIDHHSGTACSGVDFFKRTAAAFADEKEEGAWIAFNAFLDALDEHLDGAYLKLHVALEALCQEVPRPASRLLVDDSREWLAWVDRNASEIGSFAPTSESAVKLVNKVKAAQQSPATDSVDDALQALGLDPPAELKAEVRERNRSVHGFLMNRPGTTRNLSRDWDRVRILRELLTAVYARRIGYAGPIHSWRTGALGHPVVAEWWAGVDSAECRSVYRYSCLAKPR